MSDLFVYKYPFVYINNFEIRYSLIMFYIFLIVGGVIYCRDKKKNLYEINPKLNFKNLKLWTKAFKILAFYWMFMLFFSMSYFGIRYSLIIFYIFLIVWGVIYCRDKKKNLYEINPKLNFENLKLCFKNSKYVVPYLALIPIYYLNKVSNSNDSIIFLFTKKFLELEFVIYILLFVALFYGINITGNRYKYFNILKCFFSAVLYISVACTLITRQIDLFRWYNIAWFLFTGCFFIIANYFEFICPPNNMCTDPLYSPIVEFEDLFDTRKHQAAELISLIEHSEQGKMSICISGEWGLGKTSFVNSVINKISKEHNYEIIRINALEIDDTASLFIYFFSQIKSCLKRRGVYVGISSEYEDYISSALGVVTNETLVTIIKKKIFQSNKDYRDSKDNLERILETALGEDKIIVVLDDIERCSKEKIKEFIFFTKEIATMQNCISLFLTDYAILSKCVSEYEIDPNKFFDKFFNCKIILNNISFEESMKSIEENFDLKLTCYASNQSPFYDIFLFFKNRFDLAVEKKEQKEIVGSENYKERIEAKKTEIECLKQRRDQFVKLIENPRTIVKFYNSISLNVRKVNSIFTSEYIQKNKDLIEKYINKISLAESLFILSYIEACVPLEFEKIRIEGIWKYIDKLNIECNSDERLIMEIIRKYWIKEGLVSKKQEYLTFETTKFIDIFLNNPEECINIVDGYTTQEEEYISIIDNYEFSKIENIWDTIVKMIFLNFSNENHEVGENYLDKIFKYVKSKIDDGYFTQNEAYNIFQIGSGSIRFTVFKLNIMKNFYNIFCKNKGYLENNKEIRKILNHFTYEYLNSKIMNISSLIYYNIEYSQDHLLTSFVIESIDVIIVLEMYLKRVSEISGFDIEGTDIFDKINNLINVCEKSLVNYGYDKYEDVSLAIKSARKSLEDMCYFYKIVEFVSQNEIVDSFDFNKINAEDISKEIEYFEEKFDKFDELDFKNTILEFSDFFNSLKENTDNIIINDIQIQRLNKLVNICGTIPNLNRLFYRRVLLNLEKK